LLDKNSVNSCHFDLSHSVEEQSPNCAILIEFLPGHETLIGIDLVTILNSSKMFLFLVSKLIVDEKPGLKGDFFNAKLVGKFVSQNSLEVVSLMSFAFDILNEVSEVSSQETFLSGFDVDMLLLSFNDVSCPFIEGSVSILLDSLLVSSDDLEKFSPTSKTLFDKFFGGFVEDSHSFTIFFISFRDESLPVSPELILEGKILVLGELIVLLIKRDSVSPCNEISSERSKEIDTECCVEQVSDTVGSSPFLEELRLGHLQTEFLEVLDNLASCSLLITVAFPELKNSSHCTFYHNGSKIDKVFLRVFLEDFEDVEAMSDSVLIIDFLDLVHEIKSQLIFVLFGDHMSEPSSETS
jgi:hypothetical protein